MDAPTVVLTFDNLGEASELERGSWDGSTPLRSHPSVTVALPRLLDSLDAHRLRATFFVEAINCELNPDAVRAIAGRGHELGVHGFRHEQWDELDRDREAALLGRCREAFAGLGAPATGFRPPGGRLTADSPRLLCDHGFSWCSPEADAVPVASRPRWVPFRWELVDAYHLMDWFGSLREARGTSPAPGSPDAVGARIRSEIDSASGTQTIILHPFLMLDPAWWEEVQRTLGHLAELVADGTVRCATGGEAAGRPPLRSPA